MMGISNAGAFFMQRVLEQIEALTIANEITGRGVTVAILDS